MKPKKRSPLDFSRITPEPQLQAESAPAPETLEVAPEGDLAVLEAPMAQMAEPAGSPPTTTTQPNLPAKLAAPANAGPGWPLYMAALVVSISWLGAVAYAAGYRNGISSLLYDPLTMGVFVLLALGPAALVWVAAYVLRQGMHLAAEARQSRALSTQFLTPAALASAEAGSAIDGVRAQIDQAASAAQHAREAMMALHEALAEETERLAETAASSARTALQLSETLSKERQTLEGLSGTLDAQAVAVADAITRQARMVAEASDLAETQLREAEAALAARAADLAAAAGEASDAARVAGEDLSRQIARLETAGLGVSDQMRAVEEGLTEQRAALVTVAHALRADQEDFAVQAETRTAQLSEFATHARMSAAEVGETAAMGAEALRQLIASSADQFRDLTEAAADQRDQLAAAAAASLAQVAQAAAGERQSLEAELRQSIDDLAAAADNARTSAEGHGEAARIRVDQLNEAAFAAHQKADAIFEARLSEARDLIEQSAQMVEQAGARTAERLDEGVDAAKAALAELQTMLADVDARTGRMPEEARRATQEVKSAVEQGIDDLLASARKAAEETSAIDAAFQERVRRNYDMLTEAVRLMGVVSSGQTPPPARAPRSSPARIEETPSAQDVGLRPRLRLTPTATDEEFRGVFETAGGKGAAPEAEGWTWKDLLSSIEEDGGDAEGLTGRMVSEIAAMGIDPAALLPKGKLEEIAAVLQTGDAEGAREVVKKLAPAAIRRLVRRLFSDAALRGQAERYMKRFTGLLDEASGRDREGLMVAAMLASEGGRAFLLLDAAAGDLA